MLKANVKMRKSIAKVFFLFRKKKIRNPERKSKLKLNFLKAKNLARKVI